MINVPKNKEFIIGFLITSAAFLAINYRDYITVDEWCKRVADCGWSFGFPFDLYTAGTIFHFDDVLWLGLFADIVIALTVSIAIGLFASFLRYTYGSRF